MVSKTHVVELKSKYLANDLDVVESRALHACLPLTFENDADGAKTAWRAGFRKRLKELLDKEATAQLKPAELRRPVYKAGTGRSLGDFFTSIVGTRATLEETSWRLHQSHHSEYIHTLSSRGSAYTWCFVLKQLD